MIDRNVVASEKMARAKELLNEYGIDMWVIYTRLKKDTALELMFNTSTMNEVLFVLTADGSRIVLAQHEDACAYRETGMYTKVVEVSHNDVMPEFKKIYGSCAPRHMALDISTDDGRCDGLSMGLYKKIEDTIGAENMAKVMCSSYDMLEELRAVKTPMEIQIMKECSVITTDIYDALFQRIHTGMTEVGVANMMMEECAKRGVTTGYSDPNEPPLVLMPKGGMSHRGPNDINKIEPGDVLVIDFSIRYYGYTSDIARTMYFLKPGEEHAPQEIQDVANAAIDAVGKCMAMIRPGVKGCEVDHVGRSTILGHGYPEFFHSTGHQVGLEVHDGGTLLGKPGRRASEQRIRKNEIYALEPTVLQDRSKASAIIEDNVLITDDGCELISKRQISLIEIPYRTAEGM